MNNEQKQKYLADLERHIESTKQQIDFATEGNDFFEADCLNQELIELEDRYFAYQN